MDTSRITPKKVVVVKRKWHHPEIQAFVDQQEVGATMDLSDFVRAMVEEVYGDKKRFVMLSKAEALNKLLQASDSVVEEVKMTTIHVV